MLNVILIFTFVSQSLMYSNFFRLNKPPFLNRQGKPGDFPGFSKTGFGVGNKGRAIVRLGTEDVLY
jgi:hypothetical protein